MRTAHTQVDEDDHAAGLREGLDELAQVLEADEVIAEALLLGARDGIVGLVAGPVVHGDLETLLGDVQGKVLRTGYAGGIVSLKSTKALPSKCSFRGGGESEAGSARSSRSYRVVTHRAHHGEAAKSHLGLIRLRHGADPDACSRERSGKGRGSFRYFATGVGRGRRRASKRRQNRDGS